MINLAWRCRTRRRIAIAIPIIALAATVRPRHDVQSVGLFNEQSERVGDLWYYQSNDGSLTITHLWFRDGITRAHYDIRFTTACPQEGYNAFATVTTDGNGRGVWEKISIPSDLVAKASSCASGNQIGQVILSCCRPIGPLKGPQTLKADGLRYRY